MSEQKVWVEKIPEICDECPCHIIMEDRCVLLRKQAIEAILQSCPLQSIKDHNRELVAKVLKEVEDSFTAYLPLRNRTGAWFYGRLNEILERYQKEFEDGK